jgi:predicted  nucleic acid-binding Zn-ribbon protein
MVEARRVRQRLARQQAASDPEISALLDLDNSRQDVEETKAKLSNKRHAEQLRFEASVSELDQEIKDTSHNLKELEVEIDEVLFTSFVSINVAAGQMGTMARTLTRRIVSGAITGVNIRGKWYVKRDQVETTM